MHVRESAIDIKESNLFRKGYLLNILLIDRTTKKNIIWATDSYEKFGKDFLCDKRITPKLVTGKYNFLIQPRAAKSLEEQRHRTKDKAEVFTPLNIVDQINKSVDRVVGKNNWQEYVKELKLEITCGEAPFIVSRYNPTSNTGKLIKIENRVGFLDKKLKVVSKYCDNKKDWLLWAKEAFKASYGYEWQGDNVLLARENLLYTFIDYYRAKFKRPPNPRIQEEFAEIISWNIFQMDGLKYVVPMSCKSDTITQSTIYSGSTVVLEKECDGCRLNDPSMHNGDYVQIMDWEKNEIIEFVELVAQRRK